MRGEKRHTVYSGSIFQGAVSFVAVIAWGLVVYSILSI